MVGHSICPPFWICALLQGRMTPTQSKHKAHPEEKEGEDSRRQSGRREGKKNMMQMERKENKETLSPRHSEELRVAELHRSCRK